jgi:hypothetical protein
MVLGVVPSDITIQFVQKVFIIMRFCKPTIYDYVHVLKILISSKFITALLFYMFYRKLKIFSKKTVTILTKPNFNKLASLTILSECAFLICSNKF